MRNKWICSFAVVLSAIVLAEYYPGLSAGFVVDDWWFIRVLLTKSVPDCLTLFFDPRGQFIYYRPIGGAFWLLRFALFGVNPTGYHLLGVLIHLGNSLLLFGLINRVTHQVRAGFLAAIAYATMPLASQAVLWSSDAQPPATFFSLLSIWFWHSHVQSESRVKYCLAFSFALFAIYTKATSITLPILLILVDRFLIRRPTSPGGLIRRYLPFVLLVSPYPLYFVPAHSLSDPVAQAVSNLIRFLAFLSFPWETMSFAIYLWSPLAILLFVWVAVRNQSRGLALLGLALLAMLLPFLFLTPVESRYLYTPVIVVAILAGFLFEAVSRTIWLSKFGLAFALSILVLWSSNSVSEFSVYWAEISRLERLPFRNVAQRYPRLPEDTLLYFLNDSDEAWPTMALIRYGNRVSVSDINTPRPAGLRDHRNALVIYIAPQGETRELAVDMQVTARAMPELPVGFEGSIRLEGYELTRERVRRGETVGLILYWRGMQELDKDYTVFVHLIGDDGRFIEGYDGQPREGNSPTSSWRPGELVPDGRILLIPGDAPLGENFGMEIGLYYLPTMQRLSIVNSRGERIGDRVVIQPIVVSE